MPIGTGRPSAHHADITVGQDHGLHPTGLMRFFASQWGTVGPLVFGMFSGAPCVEWAEPGQSQPLRPADQRGHRPAAAVCLAHAAGGDAAESVVQGTRQLGLASAGGHQPGGGRLVAYRERQSRPSTVPGYADWPLAEPVDQRDCLRPVDGLALANPGLGELAGQRQTDPFVRLTGYKAVAQAVSSLQPLPILASDDRKLLANLSAYLPGARVYAWNPKG